MQKKLFLFFIAISLFIFIADGEHEVPDLSFDENYYLHDVAYYHTLLIENTEIYIAENPPRDTAEYLLSIIDVGENFLCDSKDIDYQYCIQNIHKATILGATNHNVFTETLLQKGPVNTTKYLVPHDMEKDLKTQLLSFVEKLHTTHGDYSNYDKLHDLLGEYETEKYKKDKDLISGTIQIGRESTKQWGNVKENRYSPFHSLVKNLSCIRNNETETNFLLGAKGNGGNNNRNLQFLPGAIFFSSLILVPLLPLFYGIVPIFDFLGFFYVVLSSESFDATATLMTAVLFSLFAPIQCIIDIVGCFEGAQNLFLSDDRVSLNEYLSQHLNSP